MSFFNKISIKSKIILIIFITNIIIVLIVLFLEIYQTKISLKKRYIYDIGQYTKMAAEECVIPLDFGFEGDAERALKTLDSKTNVKHAFLFTSGNNILAEYHSDSLSSKKIKIPKLSTNKKKYTFRGDTLIIQEKIRNLGTIIVVADTKLSEEIQKRVIVLILIFFGLSAFAFALASYLQQFISVPIVKLSDIVNSISEKKDYSIRIENNSNDEIGILNNKINNFLDLIQKREIERDKAELALRISEDRFRSLAELLPETVFEVDSNLNFSFINKAAKLMFNYSDDEIDFINFKDIISPSEHLKFEKNIKKLKNSKKARSTEYIAIKKSGKEFPVLIYTSPIYKQSALNGFRGILIDFTDLKKAQNEIKELNKYLEQRVVERTKKLAKANKELADVSYISAHDLKTPIRGISQLASWILEDNPNCIDSEFLKRIELISNRAKHMNNLVNGILTYTDIGRELIRLEDFNLKDIIDIVKKNKPTIKKIKIELIGSGIKLHYHKAHLIQIFTYLIENSINFNENKQIEIKIEVSGTAGNRIFKITDNGIGIDKKYHDNIFGIFKTLSSNYNSENIGIGLALVKKIIELYDGEITISSELEKGTEIKFNLIKTYLENE